MAVLLHAFSLLMALAFFSMLVVAHGTEEAENGGVKIVDLDAYYSSLSLKAALFSSFIIALCVILSFRVRNKQRFKTLFFLGIAIPAALTTLFIAGSTIYVNVLSTAKGPVHWHADFDVYDCGEKMQMKESEGFSNRVGSSKFHSHDDHRIHVEGVVIDPKEIELSSFFSVIGGMMTQNYMKIPINQGMVELKNGELCKGKPGKIQAFVYTTKDNVFSQKKILNFEHYVLSPHSLVPPGDCIIIEFDEEKEKTEYLCETYKTALQRGEVRGS